MLVGVCSRECPESELLEYLVLKFLTPWAVLMLYRHHGERRHHMIIHCPAGLMSPLPLGPSLAVDPEKASNLSKLPFVAYATLSLAKSGWPRLENPLKVIQ